MRNLARRPTSEIILGMFSAHVTNPKRIPINANNHAQTYKVTNYIVMFTTPKNLRRHHEAICYLLLCIENSLKLSLNDLFRLADEITNIQSYNICSVVFSKADYYIFFIGLDLKSSQLPSAHDFLAYRDGEEEDEIFLKRPHAPENGIV